MCEPIQLDATGTIQPFVKELGTESAFSNPTPSVTVH